MEGKKVNKEKAEGLVKSLINVAYNAGFLSVLLRHDSPYYLRVIEKRDELKDEIITYLVGERENEQEIKYPLRLCIDLLHFCVWGSKKTKDKTAYDIKQMLLNFFTQEEIDEALKILGIGGFGRR